jgi:hypothetical protein
MDMLDVLVVLLRAGIIKVKIDIDVPDGFVEKLDKSLLDKKIDGPELADLIDAFKGK